MNATGFAARSATGPLERFDFERRTPRSNDVVIDIHYCGVCHTDLHLAQNHFGFTTYPIVPGHEIIGRCARSATRSRASRPATWSASGAWSRPALPTLQQGLGTGLRRGADLHLRQRRPPGRQRHLRRLFRLHHRAGRLCAVAARRAGSGRRRAAALRWDHHMVAAAPLEGRQGQQGRGDRPGRAGSHGPEARQGAGRRTSRCSRARPARKTTPIAWAPIMSCCLAIRSR
jgi:hypothetical protein